MTKKILLPIDHLKSFSDKVDRALEILDSACEDFDYAFFDVRDLESKDVKDYNHAMELKAEFERYAILTSILIDHPLVKLIQSIREEHRVDDYRLPYNMISTVLANKSFRSRDGDNIEFITLAKLDGVKPIEHVVYRRNNEVKVLPLVLYIELLHEARDHNA